MEVKEKINKLIRENDVCLFMKGTPDVPQCGFSMAVSNILKHFKICIIRIRATTHKINRIKI